MLQPRERPCCRGEKVEDRVDTRSHSAERGKDEEKKNGSLPPNRLSSLLTLETAPSSARAACWGLQEREELRSRRGSPRRDSRAHPPPPRPNVQDCPQFCRCVRPFRWISHGTFGISCFFLLNMSASHWVSGCALILVAPCHWKRGKHLIRKLRKESPGALGTGPDGASRGSNVPQMCL